MKPKPSQREFVLAIIAGKTEGVLKMHKTGISVSEPDQFGWLPIHRAAANNRREIIELLVQWGSPLEMKGTDGWTPLHLASVSGSSKAVIALLKAGANANARADNGDTPLHLATISGVEETYRALFKAGAKKDIANNNGETPLTYSHNLHRKEFEEFLKEIGE